MLKAPASSRLAKKVVNRAISDYQECCIALSDNPIHRMELVPAKLHSSLELIEQRYVTSHYVELTFSLVNILSCRDEFKDSYDPFRNIILEEHSKLMNDILLVFLTHLSGLVEVAYQGKTFKCKKDSIGKYADMKLTQINLFIRKAVFLSSINPQQAIKDFREGLSLINQFLYKLEQLIRTYAKNGALPVVFTKPLHVKKAIIYQALTELGAEINEQESQELEELENGFEGEHAHQYQVEYSECQRAMKPFPHSVISLDQVLVEILQKTKADRDAGSYDDAYQTLHQLFQIIFPQEITEENSAKWVLKALCWAFEMFELEKKLTTELLSSAPKSSDTRYGLLFKVAHELQEIRNRVPDDNKMKLVFEHHHAHHKKQFDAVTLQFDKVCERERREQIEKEKQEQKKLAKESLQQQKLKEQQARDERARALELKRAEEKKAREIAEKQAAEQKAHELALQQAALKKAELALQQQRERELAEKQEQERKAREAKCKKAKEKKARKRQARKTRIQALREAEAREAAALAEKQAEEEKARVLAAALVEEQKARELAQAMRQREITSMRVEDRIARDIKVEIQKNLERQQQLLAKVLALQLSVKQGIDVSLLISMTQELQKESESIKKPTSEELKTQLNMGLRFLNTQIEFRDQVLNRLNHFLMGNKSIATLYQKIVIAAQKADVEKPEVYFYGGVVRDIALGRAKFHDLDIKVNFNICKIAAPLNAELKNVSHHPLIEFVWEDFRTEISQFSGDINLCPLNADVTMNGMYFCPKRGLIASSSTLHDCANRELRSPRPERLANSFDQVMRIIYFAAREGFVIEAQTKLAIQQAAVDFISNKKEFLFSPTRLSFEVNKSILHGNAAAFFNELINLNLLFVLFPFLSEVGSAEEIKVQVMPELLELDHRIKNDPTHVITPDDFYDCLVRLYVIHKLTVIPDSETLILDTVKLLQKRIKLPMLPIDIEDKLITRLDDFFNLKEELTDPGF